MEKRLIFAIALSLLVLLSWSRLVSKVYHIENKEATTEILPSTPPQEALPLTLEQELPAASLFQYAQDNFEITFIESLACIKEVIFKAHQNYKFPLKYGFLLGDSSLTFRKIESSSNAVVFVHSDENKKIIKQFIFSNSNYDIWLGINVQSVSNLPIKINLPLLLGTMDFSPKNIQARYQDVTAQTKDKTLHLNAHKSMEFPEAKFLSLRDRYFCSIVEPQSDNYSGFIKKLNQESEIGLNTPELTLNPGEQIEKKFHIYLGPQELRLINGINPAWSVVIYYGTFDFISQVLLQILEFGYRIMHNWGWSIVSLSLLIYFLLFPLTLKQMRSMKETQALQPQIEELRKTYKDNPQKLNKEIMELYRQHKVNPFGGCLPLLLQMPIFFALYQALMRSVALKGAKFLWIKDLSEPDRLFILPISLPILSNEINILPMVMAIGMFIQQKISIVKTSGASTEQQKMMLILMPLMFGIIFYHMASGLVLYWFINSTLMLLYQLRISASTSLSANSERSRTISRLK